MRKQRKQRNVREALKKHIKLQNPPVEYWFETKQKELEMEMLCLQEEDSLKLEYRKEIFYTRDYVSDYGSALTIVSRLPYIWHKIRNKNVFGWLDKSDMQIYRAISDSAIRRDFKKFVTGKPRVAIPSVVYSGELYGEAWVFLEWRLTHLT